MANDDGWGDVPLPKPAASTPSPAGVPVSDDGWGDVPMPRARDATGALMRGPDPGYGKAIGYGIANLVPSAHDIGAAIQAGETYLPKWMQVDDLGSDNEQAGTFGDRFTKQKARIAGTDAAVQAYHPWSSNAATIGAGAALLPVSGPVEGLGAAISKWGPAAGRLSNTALASGLVGAGYGGLYGLGEGNSLDERLQNAKSGAELGGAAGAIAPVIGAGLKGLWQAGVSRFSGEKAADKFALDRLREAYDPASTMPAADVNAARTAGQPLAAVDVLGGTKMLRLAREAANSVPEAESTLYKIAQDRYGTQGDRFHAFLQNTFNSNLDPEAFAAQHRAMAQAANAPNYAAAYQKGANGIWNSTLGRLLQSKDVARAAMEAGDIATNDAALTGNQPVRNPFVQDPKTGLVSLAKQPNGSTAVPSLQYWDFVKRALDDQIDTAYRSGAKQKAGQLTALKTQLVNQLDSAVPEYKTARDTAFGFFKANDAFEAGQNFLKLAPAAQTSKMMAAHAAMTPPQQELFARGLASQIAQTAQNTSNRRNLAALFDKPEIAQRLQVGLGSNYAPQVETFLRNESIMDRLRTALGNSWTGKNIADMMRHGGPLTDILSQALGTPLAAGVSGAVAGYQQNGADPWQIAKYAGVGAVGGALAERARNLNAATMRSVANMLATEDPREIAKTVQAMSKNPAIFERMRVIDRLLPSVSRSSASLTSNSDPSQQPIAVPAYAKGGAVKRKTHEELVSRLMTLAEKAQKEGKKQTEPTLGVHDNVVAKALSIAQKVI